MPCVAAGGLPQVHPAPGPEEVNWQHLWLSRMQRTLRGIVVWPFLLLVVLFPITLFTSAVGRVEYLFCPSVNGNSRVSGVTGAWV